ncbi:MAG TPA: bifunctional polysaccharide deacetylase/glycosyltransferase family 2 protein [Pseudonocardiaceae bacterium]|nr:bifunctional polysaccharide deacetylase/glycosyltransferase family 2 protein [Pseudonocardiaceae bacterium]
MSRHRRLPPPRAHWLLLGGMLLVVACMLALHAVTSGALGADDSPPLGSAGGVPADVRTGGPVIDATGTRPATAAPRAHAIALTFDDGPDPVWTPRILAVLDRYHVHATFFVIGGQVVRHPDLVREILAHGDEVGGHTFTHVDLRAAGTLRTDLELRATDLALADAAGISTPLVRMPYSAANDSLDDAAWMAVTRLGAAGRTVVMSTVDSQDWRRPGVARIVANATPAGSQGEVLLMHDAGGDRSQTVAALTRLIPSLQAHGWHLGTLSATVGLRNVDVTATTGARIGGTVLAVTLHTADATASALSWLLIAATVVAALRTLLVLLTAGLHARRRRQPRWPAWPEPVTVIVPAYNEAAGIEATVRSILASRHPVYVIVVDDGSTDETAGIVESLRLRRVWLIRQANAGKAAALNTGIAAARTSVVVMVDGDTVLDPNAVGALARHFGDAEVGAVSGNAKVGNRRGLLGRWQHIEYVIGFNLDRRLYDVLRCMPTVPGAIGAFWRDAVLDAGGVPTDTLAEDTDLTMALERDGWRVVYERDAIAWTEAPATVGQLWKQRYRWCYGTLQATWKHRHAVVEHGSAGKLGRRGLPYLLMFQVVLPILAPVVDVASVFGVLTGDPITSIATWSAFLALQLIPGVVAFRLDRERWTPLLTLPLQQFAYRQLMYLVVLQSVATAVAGARLPWHKLERRGQALPVDLPVD